VALGGGGVGGTGVSVIAGAVGVRVNVGTSDGFGVFVNGGGRTVVVEVRDGTVVGVVVNFGGTVGVEVGVDNPGGLPGSVAVGDTIDTVWVAVGVGVAEGETV